MTNEQKALNYYRAAFERKRPDFVPSRVRLIGHVRSDLPLLSPEGIGYTAAPGDCDCQSNKWGAVSVLAFNGQRLGVKPREFEVLKWKRNDL